MTETKMDYHFIQMHSDNYHMIYYKKTLSNCPINAIKMLMNDVWQDCGWINTLINIPFVDEYLKSINGEDDYYALMYYDNLTDEQRVKVQSMIIDYCSTSEKALELIKLLEDSDAADPIFFVLAPENSAYIRFITQHGEYLNE